jgi:hypothetical protein
MSNKILRIVEASMLLVGILGLQACFERQYYGQPGYGGGPAYYSQPAYSPYAYGPTYYAPQPEYRQPVYRQEGPRQEQREERREEREEHEHHEARGGDRGRDHDRH